MVDIGDRFVLEREAAAGGMGVVWKALDRSTGKPVALKLVQSGDDESKKRFAREASILSTLSHPAIVAYVAHGETPDGRPYLALDWVDGITLQARLERTGLSLAQAVRVGRRIAEALGHAHEHGIIHRDVEPTNLILPDGDLERIALLDFGIARPALAVGPSPEGASALTETGALVGTPAYMAPEQARGERTLGPTADVFALGALLYELLTGKRAFEGKHVLAVIAKVSLWAPPRPRSIMPKIPAELDDLVVRMIAKRPEDRPRDGSVVAAELARLTLPDDADARVDRAAAPQITIVEARRGPRGSVDKLASIVVGTRPAVAGGAAPAPSAYEVEEVTAQLAHAMRPIGIAFEVLGDASVIATIADQQSATDLVGRALACARAIRSVVPDALVAIATGDVSDGRQAALHTLIEDSVSALAKEAMALAFAGITTEARPADAVRIDETTARLAEATWPVIRLGKALFVRSDAA